MSAGRVSLVTSGVLVLSMTWGCSHCYQRPACPPPGAVGLPGPPPGAVAPPVFPAPPAQPAAPVPPPPVPSNYEPPPAPLPVQPGLGALTQPLSPPPSWQPGDGSVRLSPPQPPDNARLSVPAPLPTGPAAPAITQQRTPPPAFPVGIPQFAMVQDGVAAGLRPMLDDGLDWLQAKGYRTVLHIRRPGEDDSADRRQVEKRGMTYLSLEVSPQSLSRQVVDHFNALVSDTARYPLFVYDRDGSLAGGLWYLHFRTAEQASDEAARIRASRLGLREDGDTAQRDMWLAVQRFLSDQ